MGTSLVWWGDRVFYTVRGDEGTGSEYRPRGGEWTTGGLHHGLVERKRFL